MTLALVVFILDSHFRFECVPESTSRVCSSSVPIAPEHGEDLCWKPERFTRRLKQFTVTSHARNRGERTVETNQERKVWRR